MTEKKDSTRRSRDERLRDTAQGLRELEPWELFLMVDREICNRLLEGSLKEPVPGIGLAASIALSALLEAEGALDELGPHRALLVSKLAACARDELNGTADEDPASKVRVASAIVERHLEQCSRSRFLSEHKAVSIAIALGERFRTKVPVPRITAILRDRKTELGRATDVAMLLNFYPHHGDDRVAIQRAVGRALAAGRRKHSPA